MISTISTDALAPLTTLDPRQTQRWHSDNCHSGHKQITAQITKFMLPKWGPPGSCRSQMGPMLVPWTLLSGSIHSDILIPRRPNAYGLPNRYRSPVGTAGLVRFIKASVGLWKQRYLKFRMRSVSDISLCNYVVSHENKSVVREAGIKKREQVITSHNIYGIHLFVVALGTCSIWHITTLLKYTW